MNLLCTGTFVMQLYTNYHIQECYDKLAVILLWEPIEIAYTFLAPPTSSLGIHVR